MFFIFALFLKTEFNDVLWLYRAAEVPELYVVISSDQMIFSGEEKLFVSTISSVSYMHALKERKTWREELTLMYWRINAWPQIILSHITSL